MEKIRCTWAINHPLLENYHDTEWGTPLHNDHKLFEFLILDAMQAGLSWLTILKKREGYREAFADFDYEQIAQYRQKEIDELMNNPNIIRNKAKIEAVIKNASAFMTIQKEYGSFDAYIWNFPKNKIIHNQWQSVEQIPTATNLSDTISTSLKKYGFGFIGTTSCYAFLQSIGMVNDHIISCFRYSGV